MTGEKPVSARNATSAPLQRRRAEVLEVKDINEFEEELDGYDYMDCGTEQDSGDSLDNGECQDCYGIRTDSDGCEAQESHEWQAIPDGVDSTDRRDSLDCAESSDSLDSGERYDSLDSGERCDSLDSDERCDSLECIERKDSADC